MTPTPPTELETPMRSMKNGNLTFGLVNVAVKMFKATEDHDVKFHLHHAGTCLGAVGQQQVCKSCSQVLTYQDTVKGIDRDGQTVIVTREEIAELDDEAGSQIEVTAFVDRDEIDPIMYEGTYYLDPTKGSEQGYALLRQVLVDTNRVGVVSFTLRQRTHTGVVRVIGSDETAVLAIHTTRWPDEVRPTAELTGARAEVELSPKLLDMAHLLVESMVAPWDPTSQVDTYAARLSDLIDAKAAGGHLVSTPRVEDTHTDVSDLLAKLEASVASKASKASKKGKARKATVSA